VVPGQGLCSVNGQVEARGTGEVERGGYEGDSSLLGSNEAIQRRKPLQGPVVLLIFFVQSAGGPSYNRAESKYADSNPMATKGSAQAGGEPIEASLCGRVGWIAVVSVRIDRGR